MSILSAVARTITSRGRLRVEQIQLNSASSTRLLTCSCPLCGAEAPRPSEEESHSGLMVRAPVFVEHSNEVSSTTVSESPEASHRASKGPETSAWGSLAGLVPKRRPVPLVVKRDPAPTSGNASSTSTTAPAPKPKEAPEGANRLSPTSAKWGTFHAQQVHGPAPDPTAKARAKNRPRPGTAAPRWTPNSLPSEARSGEWGGFHRLQDLAASKQDESEKSLVVRAERGDDLAVDDGHGQSPPADATPLIGEKANSSLKSSSPKGVSGAAKEAESDIEKADCHQAHILHSEPYKEDGHLKHLSKDQCVSSTPQDQPTAVPSPTTEREEGKPGLATNTEPQEIIPDSVRRTVSGSWGAFLADFKNKHQRPARAASEEVEADAPAPYLSVADVAAISPTISTSGPDVTSDTNVRPEAAPENREKVTPLIADPYEPYSSPAKLTPATDARPRLGFITQVEAIALIDRLSCERGVPAMKAAEHSSSEGEPEVSSTQLHPDRHQPVGRSDTVTAIRAEALSLIMDQELPESLHADNDEHGQTGINKPKNDCSKKVGAEERRTKDSPQDDLATLASPAPSHATTTDCSRRHTGLETFPITSNGSQSTVTEQEAVAAPSEDAALADNLAWEKEWLREHRIMAARKKLRTSLQHFDLILEQESRTLSVECRYELDIIRDWLLWIRLLVGILGTRRGPEPNWGICALCERTTDKITRHHLIPKGERDHDRFTVKEMNKLIRLCEPCHGIIHRVFSNEELAIEFNSLELLTAHPRIQSWLMFAKQHSMEELHRFLVPLHLRRQL
ncbi:HNH endonuclease [Colletotrichum orchidophilum]|uniref:HNH endonuclease n=1 Tax=Colletotrichum orchidophilum TaxID=1209926 RepID=A0A1G4B7C9_9PEZI|nr:HNH endonuclease [Colletotrichum orchidophilum]OHE97175.1 HNH endonuclease [Colletotrichum orchidophilum]